MKKTRLLLTTCLAAFTLLSCSESEPTVELNKPTGIKFDASIENTLSRASGTTWDANDAIGVYMKTAGGNLTTTTISGAENVKYTTVGSNIFTSLTNIQFPADGSSVDFIAYYPYQTTISSFTYPINVSNQTDLPKIDLLYSNNAVNADKANSTVNLNFKHKLSQLILNITAGDGVTSLAGLTVSVSDLIADGSFNLATGDVTLGSTQATLTPVVNSASATAATVNAILVPKQDLSTAKVVFALNGKVYEWTPNTQLLESGKKYTYPVQLTTTGLVVLAPSGTIEDWTEGNTGGSNVILTPSDNPVFTADKASVALAATAASNDVIQLTTQSDQAWTATSNQPWLTVSPTSGTGSTQITLTTTEANTGAARPATVTLTPTGGTLTPVTITVTQAAGSVTPVANLLFPGSDFNDWSGFVAALSTHGLKGAYTMESSDGGRNGSGALHLNGTPTANEYVFTGLVPAGGFSTTPSKIVLYIKGTAGKSLSLNVYKANGTNYEVFNLGTYTTEAVLDKAAPNGTTGNGTNSYTGTINTGGNWMKVTLNLSDVDICTTAGESVFSLKVGKEVVYDLYVDDITFE